MVSAGPSLRLLRTGTNLVVPDGHHPGRLPLGAEPRAVLVLLDIDEVLFPFADAYDSWLTRHRGVGLDAGPKAQYRIEDAAGPGHNRLVVEFLNDPHTVADVEPVVEAATAVGELSKRCRLIACTRRHQSDEGAATRAWLKHWLPVIEDVVFVRDVRGGAKRAKASVCRELEAAALVEDSIEHLLGLPSTTRGVLVRRPHGLNSAAGSLSWTEALDGIQGLLPR